MRYTKANVEVVSFNGRFMTASHGGIDFHSASGTQYECVRVTSAGDTKIDGTWYHWVHCPQVYSGGHLVTNVDGFSCADWG